MKNSIPLAASTLALLGGAAARAQDAPAAKLGASILQVDGLGEPTGLAFGRAAGELYVAEALGRRVSVLGPNGERLREFGTDALVDPRDVAVAADGRVVVSDSGKDSVFVFDTRGKVVVEVGGSGSRPGRLNGPEGVDVAGELFAVADSRNDRVQVFRLDGTFVTAFGASGEGEADMNRPADVAFAPDGSLYVADSFHQRVQCFAKDGKFLRAFGTPGPNPGQFGGPTGLALHGGFVHVVDRDNSRVQIFSAAGELHSWYGIHALRPREGQGKLHYPLRIALSADGTRAALSEPVENRVQVLGPVDPNVEELPPLPALPPSHYGGAIDTDGPLLALTEPSIPKVLLFQMLDGEPIEFGSFGTYGTRPGQLLWPTDVVIDVARRRVYVADSGAARLSEYSFRYDPKDEVGFDPERVRFVASIELRDAELPELLDGWATPTIEPAGLWRDGEGGLCLSDARQPVVWRFDGTLRMTGASAPPQGRYAFGDGCAAAASADPKAPREQYVVERISGSVLALPSGKAVASKLARPAGVLVTSAGVLYVTDEGAHALLQPNRADPVVARGPGLGPRELTKPRGLAELPGGRVILVDWGSHRGLIFDQDDKFVRAFGSLLFIRPTFQARAEKTPEPAVAMAPAPPAAELPKFDGSRPWHAANACLSNDGTYVVFWRPTPDPIQERQTFALDVWVSARATPNELARGVSVELDAAMPEHGHGMNVVPRTTQAPDGHFRIEGTRLHMPGRWEVYFDIRVGRRTERAQLTLELE